MRKLDKKALLAKLAALSQADRRSLYRQAARKRKAAASKRRSSRENFTKKYHDGVLDDRLDGDKRTKRGPVSLEDWVLKLLGHGDFDHKAAQTDAKTDTLTGMVISSSSSSCTVVYDAKRYKCLLRPEIAMAQRSDLAVGDNVTFSETFIVEEVLLPRKTILSRPDPHDHRLERVIAANIDTTVIVTSVSAPPLNTNLIDRYLLAIERGGIEPLICVNKIDLLDEDARESLIQKMRPYKSLGIKIIECSALCDLGMNKLTDQLADKIAVLVGHSGVGKSSLLNTIEPSLKIPVRNIRKANDKGRHVTVNSNLYELPQNIKVIDTPGVRSFGLWKMEPDDLRWYFDEFDDYTQSCKYHNCTHTHEPDCAVKQAVQDGNILPMRHESYCRLFKAIRESRK